MTIDLLLGPLGFAAILPNLSCAHGTIGRRMEERDAFGNSICGGSMGSAP